MVFPENSHNLHKFECAVKIFPSSIKKIGDTGGKGGYVATLLFGVGAE